MTTVEPPPAIDLTDVRRRVDGAVASLVERESAKLLAIGTELAPVASAISDFAAGGKRIRPLFAYCGWAAAGGDNYTDDVIIDAVSALELVQVAALVHDDVIDDSDSRRGKPSVHARLGTLHHDNGWHGSSRDFGEAAAILIGDLGLIWADAMLRSSGLSPQVQWEVREVFDDMRTEVMAGQYLDVLASVDPSAGEDALETALRVARLKAASYTVARPLQMGAVIAGASPEVLTAYAKYGLNIGVAFQLRDDLLGVFGDPSATGKPAGDDLREGKRTALIAHASLRSGDADLVSRVGAHDLSDEEIENIKALLMESGAVSDVEEMIADRSRHAIAALAGVELTAPGREALNELALAAAHRTY